MMKMFRIPAIVLTLTCLPALAGAQTIDGYVSRIYNQGAQTPLQTTDLLVANITCNQTPPAANASTVNPARVVFDDVANAGKVCMWTDPGGGILASLPFGQATYEGTLAAANSAGTGPESNRAPFSRPGLAPTNAPAGVRYVR